VIESVLKMTNAPTKSAMPAKARRKYSMNCVNSLISSLSSWASATPDRTWAVGGRTGSIALISSARVTPSRPATEISSTWPSRWRSFWAVRNSHTANVAVPREFTSPKRAMPVSVNSRTGSWLAILTRSPTS
jgi:hypothetical protein